MAKLFYSNKTYELVKKASNTQKTVISVGKHRIGSKQFVVMAGPCTVESREQILRIAKYVKSKSAHILRGGAYKPCTYPYRFRGYEEDALKWLREAGDKTSLPLITEVMDTRDVEIVARYADILQIGTRNMQNYRLLTEVGRTKKPVFLKRGTWATLDEFLGAAEYIMKEGNRDVILCERGIVSLETHTRWTLSLATVPALKKVTHLPVIVDPSHGTGNRDYVIPMAKAAAACGADGIMVEVHFNPEKSVSDAVQTIDFKGFSQLMSELEPVVKSVGRFINKVKGPKAKYGLVAARNIRKNTKITRDMITTKSRCDGLSPKLSKDIIGKKAIYDIKEGEPITFGVVEI